MVLPPTFFSVAQLSGRALIRRKGNLEMQPGWTCSECAATLDRDTRISSAGLIQVKSIEAGLSTLTTLLKSHYASLRRNAHD